MKMTPAIEEIILVVDFNQLEGDSLPTYLDFSIGPFRPEVGAWARLIDGEGNSCVGYVRRIRDGVVEVVPDWATWTVDTPAWATWAPPSQVAKRARDLRETLRRARKQPDEDSLPKEGPTTRPLTPVPS